MIDHGSKCNGEPCTCGAKVEQEKTCLAGYERCKAKTDDGRGPTQCTFNDWPHPSYCKTEDGRYFNRV